MTAEASTPIAAPEVEQRWILVSASGSRLAIELDAVREVVPVRACTRIPGAPAYVRGLMNLRGSILTVIDLAARLDLPWTTSPAQRVVVLQHEGRDVGVAVSEVLRIASVLEGEGGTFQVIDRATLLGPIFEIPEDR